MLLIQLKKVHETGFVVRTGLITVECAHCCIWAAYTYDCKVAAMVQRVHLQTCAAFNVGKPVQMALRLTKAA